METLTSVYEFLKPYFAVIALSLTWAGVGGSPWWRQRGLVEAERVFLGQVNFSLNLFGDTLAMRTLLEVDTSEVWPNSHGVKLLHAAAGRTSVDDPFIRLAIKEDRDYLHRAVKNALSELLPDPRSSRRGARREGANREVPVRGHLRAVPGDADGQAAGAARGSRTHFASGARRAARATRCR